MFNKFVIVFLVFIGSYYFGIVSLIVVKKQGIRYGMLVGSVVGMGVFILESWKVGDCFNFCFNFNYWGIRSILDCFVFCFIKDLVQCFNEVCVGMVDFISNFNFEVMV